MMSGLTACVAALGCARGGPGPVVATSWTAAERAGIDAAYAAAGHPGSVAWVIVEPGIDPTRLAGRAGSVDVLLGGPAAAYAEIPEAFEPPGADGPGWLLVRRGEVGTLGPARPGRTDLSIPDPRLDPRTLAAALRRLERNGWVDGYAALVRLAGAVDRFERVPALDPPGDPPTAAWDEGLAILRDAPHPGAARAFADLLGRTHDARPPEGDEARPDPARPLAADLLGATLVDALPELHAAWATLRATGYPERAARWMTRPPPWPPASVERLRAEGKAPALRETLAEQIAPDPAARAWLLASWDDAPRPVDAAFLDDLARAAGGRLAADPRFRGWLRGEWTAWARQRYRRVAVNARQVAEAEAGGRTP